MLSILAVVLAAINAATIAALLLLGWPHTVKTQAMVLAAVGVVTIAALLVACDHTRKSKGAALPPSESDVS
jgi:hypothetical protein